MVLSILLLHPLHIYPSIPLFLSSLQVGRQSLIACLPMYPSIHALSSPDFALLGSPLHQNTNKRTSISQKIITEVFGGREVRRA